VEFRHRIRKLIAYLVAALIAAFVLRMILLQPEPRESAAPGYYTGPFRSKGDPEHCYTEDGKLMPCPSGPLKSKKPTLPAGAVPD